jgi:hypothetical protein
MRTSQGKCKTKHVSRTCESCFLPDNRLTIIETKVDVGEGNALYIRGIGEGLSWASGQPLSRGFGGSWIWKTSDAKGKVLFQLLLNDRIWAKGKGLTIDAGKMIEVAPSF